MDITKLQDRTVIALAYDVSMKEKPRSKKEPGIWKAGTRFLVRGYFDPERRLPQTVWELRRVSRGITRETVHPLADSEEFLRIVMASEPVRDVEAVLAAVNPTAEQILQNLTDQRLVTIEQIEEAAARIDRDDAMAAEAMAAAVTPAGEAPGPGDENLPRLPEKAAQR